MVFEANLVKRVSLDSEARKVSHALMVFQVREVSAERLVCQVFEVKKVNLVKLDYQAEMVNQVDLERQVFADLTVFVVKREKVVDLDFLVLRVLLVTVALRVRRANKVSQA